MASKTVTRSIGTLRSYNNDDNRNVWNTLGLGRVHSTQDSSCAGKKIIPDWTSVHTKERWFRRDFCNGTVCDAVALHFRDRRSVASLLHRLPATTTIDLATERERHLTTEKRAKTTKLDFRCSICRSAIGQSSCLICACRRQPTFRFCC